MRLGAKGRTLLAQAELVSKVSPNLEAKLAAAWWEILTEGGSFVAAVKQGAFRLGLVVYPLLARLTSGEG